MRIALMSDLHFEHHHDKGAAFVQQLNPTGVDVLVLAGDIMSARFTDTIQKAFSGFCNKYKHVLYVPGNHEHYRSDPKTVQHNLKTVAREFQNLHILEINRPVKIDGQRFLGDTMWFPDLAGNQLFKHYLNDFSLITDLEPWVYSHNGKFRNFLQSELTNQDVVVTHHLPTRQSVHHQYRHSGTNCFFVCEMDDLMMDRQPKLWLHGHTHSACDYQYVQQDQKLNTRIVCNPRGYPGEKTRHYGPLKIDL